MRGLQGTGWLLVGLALAVLVPVTGVHRLAVDLLGRFLGLPWAGILVGALLFGTCAGLYFRAHWAATARAHAEAVRRAADAAERLERIGGEIERAAFLIDDNLQEVDGTTGSRRQLFLDGARAHAGRLSHLAKRCRGLSSRLGPPRQGREGRQEDDRA